MSPSHCNLRVEIADLAIMLLGGVPTKSIPIDSIEKCVSAAVPEAAFREG